MILNVDRFVREERPYWEELEQALSAAALSPRGTAEAKRFFYLYRRAASGLVKLNTLAAGPDARRYLETLVARAYAEIHAAQDAPSRFRPFHWFGREFPRAVRAHHRALWTSIAITLAGAIFGAVAVYIDAEAKSIIIPFSHLEVTPTERVEQEQATGGERISGHESSFAAMLMQNNIRVSILAAALGMTFAIGTVTMLFYNGVIIGAVAYDYVQDGQVVFLLGWLLPHGAVEIPASSSQAGWPGPGQGAHRLRWRGAPARAHAPRGPAPGLSPARRRGPAGVGGHRRGLLLAIPRADPPLLGENCLR